MPFCSNCGAQVDDGSRFCMSCGSPVDAPSAPAAAPVYAPVAAPVYAPVSPYAQQGNIRQESIAEINKMIQYFSQKQAQYDEYDDCCEKIEFYSDPRSRVKVKGGVAGTLFKVFGLIMTIGGGIYSLFSLITLAAAISMLSSGARMSSEDYSVIAAFMIPIVILIAGIVLLVLSGVKRRAYARKAQSEKERMLAYYEERYDALANELNAHFLNYGYCPVAASYTNPRILALIREPINLGRADTIKEAINVMIMDSHNSEMELQARLAAQSAASAARGAKAAAFFSAANFIRHF